MIEPVTLPQVQELAARLPAEERRRLAVHILDELAGAPPKLVVTPGRSWLEIRGSAPYPLLGEDAQGWVSHSRQESDEHRERSLRRGE